MSKGQNNGNELSDEALQEIANIVVNDIDEMSEHQQMAVEQSLVQEGQKHANSTVGLGNDSETSDLEVIKEFLPNRQETESKTAINHDMAVALSQMEQWGYLLKLDDPEVRRLIDEFRRQFEKRRISATNGREQFTRILSAVANAEFDNEGNAKGLLEIQNQDDND